VSISTVVSSVVASSATGISFSVSSVMTRLKEGRGPQDGVRPVEI
jgi:hypothetical protein